MLGVLGAGLLFAGPRASMGRCLNLVILGLIFLALAAFLPAAWFHPPAWRTALTGDFGVTLPATLTPQPFLTAESLVVFAAGLAWFSWMVTVRWTDEERRRAGAIYAGGTVALAVLCVALHRAGVVPSFWHSERRFGPFPNRNQTADFFAVSALPVLACARAAWRTGRKPAALAWLAGWLAVAAAVTHSFSRAGLVILFATTAVYLVLETFHRTREQPMSRLVWWRRFAMVSSLVLVLGSGLLVFGGDTLARLGSGGTTAGGNTLSNALRLSIYADTVHLINASPWCGNGLDTFAQIFPTYRRLANQNTLGVLHPESDWLWLAAELGWPGTLIALVGLGLVVRRLRPPRHGHDRPLRLAATLGVAGFLMHGLVDVSAHRIGSSFAALFLLGLALPGRGTKPDDSVGGAAGAAVGNGPGGSVWAWRSAGVVFLLVGALWLTAALDWLRLPGEQGVRRLQKDALALAGQHDYPAASLAATQSLAWSPLDWQGYYLRASSNLLARCPADETLADFRRARYLDPFNPRLPLAEARLWAAAGQTGPAVSALLEACRRDASEAGTMLRSVYVLARDEGAFAAQFGAAARRNPVLTAAFLEALEPGDAPAFVEQVLQRDPDLQHLNGRQKTRFFRAWLERGEPGSLAAGMAAHPGWQPLGWRWWAEARARDGTPAGTREACEIAGRFALVPEVPTVNPELKSVAEWQRAARAAAFEPESALPLYRAQEAAKDVAGALGTLQQVTAQRDCPPYFLFLEAKTAGELGQWSVSWTAWQKYLFLIKANE